MFPRPLVQTMVRAMARVGESAPRSAQISRAVLISLVAEGIATVVVPVNTGAGVKQVYIPILPYLFVPTGVDKRHTLD